MLSPPLMRLTVALIGAFTVCRLSSDEAVNLPLMTPLAERAQILFPARDCMASKSALCMSSVRMA